MNARVIGITSLVLLAVLLVAVNVLAGAGLRSARLDLTEGKLYTLTQGSKNIAKSPAEPITLTFYYSAKAAQGRPQIQSIAGRIAELLDEFARASGGKVVVRTVDPEAFSEEEDKAVQAGLSGVPMGASGEQLYLGLVGANTIGGRETIPIFDISNERFIEYDIARLIQSLSMVKKPVVAVISSLQLDGGFTMDPQSGRPVQRKGWAFLRELKQLYDVKMLSGENITIPAETDVLLVIHPKNLNVKTQFAIDQYVLKGKKAIVFVDPLCESDEAQPAMRGAPPPERSSNLEGLFAAWGVGFDPTKVAADATMGTRLFAGQPGGRQQQLIFPPYITVNDKGLSKSDPATGKVTSINFATPGSLTKKAPADPANQGAEFTPIIETTDNSELIEAATLMSLADPASILANFKPGGKKLTLAARLSGELKTAFPQGDPAAAQAADPSKQGPATPPSGDSLKQSTAPAGIVVVADVDMLSDRMWIREQTLGGITLGSMKMGDNIDFLTTCIDTMTGSGDLLNVRSRGEYIRPFTRVEEIQRNAEQKYRAEDESLKKKGEAAQQRIMEIQRKRPDAPENGAIILTDDQKKELETLRAETVETKKQQRKVQFNLRQDVENLGSWIKVINVGLVPVVVMLIALLWAIARLFTRRAAARAGG